MDNQTNGLSFSLSQLYSPMNRIERDFSIYPGTLSRAEWKGLSEQQYTELRSVKNRMYFWDDDDDELSQGRQWNIVRDSHGAIYVMVVDDFALSKRTPGTSCYIGVYSQINRSDFSFFSLAD